MIKTINEYDFTSAFRDSEICRDKFSYGALKAIFAYYEEREGRVGGNPIELDIVATACDLTEYASAWDAMEQYQPEDMPVEGEEGDDLLEINEKNEQAARQWLEERTTVLYVTNYNSDLKEVSSIVIVNF